VLAQGVAPGAAVSAEVGGWRDLDRRQLASKGDQSSGSK
jgi:hypothetical protein